MEDCVHNEELLTPEIVEAMGISQPAFEEVQCIIGRMPTVEELSTLLAMWDANGRQQSLYGWLKGQHHLVEKQEYLYTGTDTTHKEIREPRVKECIALAHEVVKGSGMVSKVLGNEAVVSRGENLYMVGNVSTDFLDSEYARRCLHIVAEPMKMTTEEEDIEYLELILGSLLDAGVITSARAVGQGGLFAALVESCKRSVPVAGFDVLTCREIRLDAFLFGEERGRYVVSLPEKQDDLFLLKMDEARVNCCFLGHATKGRVLVDDMDWGYVKGYFGERQE
jgi:phosphoribosylformylglycinamidine (FGAM) synthase-like enzyme